MTSPTQARALRDALRGLVLAHGTLKEARRPCGMPLSLPHAYALLELHQSKTLMSVSELAARLSIDRTNVSRLCSRMESAGDLTRRAHPEDRRALILELTERGQQVAMNVDKYSAAHFGNLALGLGDQVAAVIESLELLTEAMKHDEETK